MTKTRKLIDIIAVTILLILSFLFVGTIAYQTSLLYTFFFLTNILTILTLWLMFRFITVFFEKLNILEEDIFEANKKNIELTEKNDDLEQLIRLAIREDLINKIQ